jgi:hypothetical protein
LLQASQADGTVEEGPMPVTIGSDKPFFPVKPIRVPSCSEALFKVVSPTCVVVQLTFVDEQNRTGSIVNTVRLRNRNLAR